MLKAKQQEIDRRLLSECTGTDMEEELLGMAQ